MIRIKTTDQIAGIRASCRLAARCLDFIRPYVVPGVTTDALDQKLESYIRDHGAIPACLGYMGFPRSTCISPNDVICHGIPGSTVLRDGDIVNIDVTTILDGYYGDTSTMYAAGEITVEAARLLKVARGCLDVGVGEVRPGNRFGNIGHQIYHYATLHNCSVVYQFSGHGVGLQFHEPPNVCHVARKDSGSVMRPGMIFTVEPMINQGRAEAVIDNDGWTARTADGTLSAQFEHTVLVTPEGVEVLTLP